MLSSRQPLLLAVLATSSACAAPAPPPVVVVIGAPSAAVASSPRPPEPAETCTAFVFVEKLALDPPTCFVDAKVQDRPGELTYPCGGGKADARFPGSVFQGAVTSGRLDVSLTTRFDWEDGCKWASEQHISGPISARTLEYTYTEGPLPGQEGCMGSCTARAKVRVRPRAGR
jgi:hypothetical protein